MARAVDRLVVSEMIWKEALQRDVSFAEITGIGRSSARSITGRMKVTMERLVVVVGVVEGDMLQIMKLELLPDTICALVRSALFLSSWSIFVNHFMDVSYLLRATFTLTCCYLI